MMAMVGTTTFSDAALSEFNLFSKQLVHVVLTRTSFVQQGDRYAQVTFVPRVRTIGLSARFRANGFGGAAQSRR
jgi:hypothetical protein